MEKTYKRVPFDIDLAKKIQSGEVEGRICYKLDDYVCSVRIVCWNRKDDFYHIIAVYCTQLNQEGVLFLNEKGTEGYGEPPVLFIELPEETQEHEFKPFDKVLVRFDKEDDDDVWSVDIFSHYTGNGTLYRCMLGTYKKDCIIPYEGNEHLVGTTDEPKED